MGRLTHTDTHAVADHHETWKERAGRRSSPLSLQ